MNPFASRHPDYEIAYEAVVQLRDHLDRLARDNPENQMLPLARSGVQMAVDALEVEGRLLDVPDGDVRPNGVRPDEQR